MNLDHKTKFYTEIKHFKVINSSANMKSTIPKPSKEHLSSLTKTVLESTSFSSWPPQNVIFGPIGTLEGEGQI